MGFFSSIGNFASDVGDLAKSQIRPFLPRNAAEALFPSPLLLSSIHKSQDIGKKVKENEQFEKRSMRRAAIERAMGPNRFYRTPETPKPLDLSDYAAADAIKKILFSSVGSAMASGGGKA